MNRLQLWRTTGFVAVYGLAVVGVTAAFWRSPQPSADTVTPLTTRRITGSNSSTGSVATLDPVLTQAVPLSANAAYGIEGSAAFVNSSTALLKGFSIIGRGPKTQIELRDSDDQTLAVVRDITKLSLNREDLVLALPNTIELAQVASLAVVAPDYNLVLSRARWK